MRNLGDERHFDGVLLLGSGRCSGSCGWGLLWDTFCISILASSFYHKALSVQCNRIRLGQS